MIDDVVGIASGIFRRPVFVDHAAEAEPGAEIEQHRLKGAHVAVGRDDRLANGVGRPVG